MHRQSILSALDHYSLKGSLEDQALVLKYQYFIKENPHCFDRALEKGHLTASCWLWNLEKTACLFTHHKKLNRWLQLGGHADGECDLLRVALKEAQEESGILEIKPLSLDIFDLAIHEVPKTPYFEPHLHFDVRFLLQVEVDKPLIVSSESHDLKWIKLEEFEYYPLDESILKMRTKVNNFV